MRFTCLTFIIYLLCIHRYATAQTSNTYKDSLLRVIQRQARDTNTLKAMQHLYKYSFNTGDLKTSLQYCRQALALAKELKLTEKVPRITYSIGLNFTNLTQYDSAAWYLQKAASIAGTDTILRIQSYNARGMLASNQSDYSTAIDWLLKAAAVEDSATSPDIKSITPQTYAHLGYNFMAEKQYEKGIEYEKKALTYTNYPDEQRYRTLLYLDIADTYVKLNDARQAGIYLDSAVTLNKTLNNAVVSILTANTSGGYYEYIKDLPHALADYREAYRLCDSMSNEYQKAQTASNIANILYLQENNKEAEQYALIANKVALDTKNFRIAAIACEILKNIYARQGNYKTALDYAGRYKQYADSATNSESQKVTLSLESRYQNQKKEKELAELQIVSAAKEITIIKRNRLLLTGGIIAITLLSMIGLLYRNSRQKQVIATKEQRIQQEHILFLERQQQVVSLQSMLNGQETERTRIARDLHDGLGGLFSTVKMNLSSLQHEHGNLQQDALFRKSYELVDTASSELRRIAHNMMPEVLMKLGLIQAIQDMCASISAGRLLQVSVQAYGMHQRLNAPTEIMLYRIIQELINNIIKHAQASEAIIQFNKDGNRLSVTVEDNGRGFNLQEVDTTRHRGMETIKSRVDYLNGQINIDSQGGIGTTILMEFLLHEEA